MSYCKLSASGQIKKKKEKNVILSGCVSFCCYVGVVDDALGEAVVFLQAVVFFPAVTVVFHGGCLACFEDFSVVLLNYGLQVVCAAIAYLYIIFVENLVVPDFSENVCLRGSETLCRCLFVRSCCRAD